MDMSTNKLGVFEVLCFTLTTDENGRVEEENLIMRR